MNRSMKEQAVCDPMNQLLHSDFQDGVEQFIITQNEVALDLLDQSIEKLKYVLQRHPR